MERVTICSQCGYASTLKHSSGVLHDDEGNVIKLRESCPSCNWFKRLSSTEIDAIVRLCKS